MLRKFLLVSWLIVVLPSIVEGQTKTAELHPPIRLEADGAPIDLGRFAQQGHAGPCFADVDCDGKMDLLVGAYPGKFWLFRGTDRGSMPEFQSPQKLQAGGEDAETPIY